MDELNMVDNVDSNRTPLTPTSNQLSKSSENFDDRKSNTSQHNADSGYYSSGNIECITVADMKIQSEKQNLDREDNCVVCTANAPYAISTGLYTNNNNFSTNNTSTVNELNFNKNNQFHIPRTRDGHSDISKMSSAISNPLVLNNSTHSDAVLYRISPTSGDSNGIIENESLNEDATDLAMKIEFCLKFGYTINQIRSAISKLSCKATKNDILSELFNCSSGAMNKQHIPIPNNILSSQCRNLSNNKSSDVNASQQVSRGLDSPVKGQELRARGPSTFENESKEKTDVEDDSENLRPVVIDGSNVAMSHGNKQYFSCKGILIAVDYFRQRNHRDITVFIPTYRKESPRPDAPIRDREILDILERERILVYTPSRCINGKRITCYDDRFILRLAEETEGVIVSNDNFRDLQSEKPQWKELIEKRLLMYSFVNDRFMPPDDPLGRNGPSIDNFLRKRPECEEQSKPQCPYGKKCTYGKKCKYFHPECSFSQKSVTERLKENNEKRFNKTSSDAEQLAVELMKSPPQKTNQPKASSPQRQVIKQEIRRHQPPITEHQQQPAQQDQHLKNHSINNQMQNGSYGYSNHPQPNYQTAPPCDELNEDLRQLSLSNSSIQLNQQLQQQQQQQQQHRFATCQQQQRIPQVYLYPDGGPPAFHKNSPQNVRSHGSMGQPQPRVHPHPYQHSSPPNFQIQERTGNPPPPHQAFPNIQSYPHYNLPPNPVYHHMYPEMQYQQQPMQQILYPYSMARHNSPIHTLVQPSPMYSSGSHRSESSLSHSYPFVQSDDRLHVNLVNAGHNHSSPNPEDPKTYPPSTSRRVYSSPNHPQQQPIVHSVVRPHTHTPQMEPQPRQTTNHPLNSTSNPRHNLYKNLCGLFSRSTVEDIMLSNPNEGDPRILIKMCLEETS